MESYLGTSRTFVVMVLAAMLPLYTGHEARCSKYDFEEKVLSKLIRLEYSMELLTERMKKAEHIISQRQEALENEKENMIKDIEELKENLLQEQRTQKGRIEQQLQNQMATFTRMSTDLETLTNDTIASTKAQTIRPTVLFSTTSASASSVSNGNAIIYTDVLENTGDGYDSSTGVFTAPLEGVYIFSAQICTQYNTDIYVQIVADDTVLTAAGHGDRDYSSMCTTTTAFGRVQAGARVIVKCATGCSSSDLAESKKYYRNTFAGLLIH